MTNPMMKKWAEALVQFSAPVKPGNSVLITGGVQAEPLLRAIYDEVVEAGGYPVMVPLFTGIQASLLNNGTDEQLQWISPIEHFTRE
ncbi:MAG TPA: aminopeptidase, partial [Thermomicrobiales bacterium]|nr:aminopeptidase [Thermomicrobiales bacterium]